jgi:hypothetical protein
LQTCERAGIACCVNKHVLNSRRSRGLLGKEIDIVFQQIMKNPGSDHTTPTQPSHLWRRNGVLASIVSCMIAAAACTGGDAVTEIVEIVPPANEVSAPAPAPKAEAPGVLVSPELFDLAAKWSSESLSTRGAGPALDLVSYVKAHAPGLLGEAAAAVTAPAGAAGGISPLYAGCTCAVWATFMVQTGYNSGGGWHTSNTGPAHDGHIYQSQSGHKTEITSNQTSYSTQFRTRMNCSTPTGAACAAGCTAKLYADVQYGSRAYAEAHTWTIWDKAGTTQVVDGVTLNLRTPFGGAGQRLFEKEIAATQAANSTAFDVNQFVSFVKSSLGIYAAVQTNTYNLIPDLLGKAIKSLVGIIHRTGGSNGSISEVMNVSYETYFDQLTPIAMSYSSTDNLYYGLDLTSLVRMKVRGWGYHSETGDLKSSYSMAVYMDNFVCDGSVTTPPQRAGFWRYDGYSEAPLSVSSLQSRVNSFFNLALGINVNTSANQGTIYQGVCGNNVCDTYETPQTCAVDCGYCGNGVCRSVFENANNCVQDCGYCGDNYCYGSETPSSCVSDCGWCGDNQCAGSESVYNCPSDCASCGDGVCSSGESGWCTTDCGGCNQPYATGQGAGDGSNLLPSPLPCEEPWEP